MTQAQFFQAVADGSQVSKAQVRAVFAAVEEVVTKRLKAEGKIPLGGLGAVKLVDRKARIGRNPATGEQIRDPGPHGDQAHAGEGAEGHLQQEGEEGVALASCRISPAGPRGRRAFSLVNGIRPASESCGAVERSR